MLTSAAFKKKLIRTSVKREAVEFRANFKNLLSSP